MLALGGAAEANTWHAGLNMRSELGTHPIRIDGGVEARRCARSAASAPSDRSAVGVEVAAVVGKPGGALPTDMLSLDSMADVGDSDSL